MLLSYVPQFYISLKTGSEIPWVSIPDARPMPGLLQIRGRDYLEPWCQLQGLWCFNGRGKKWYLGICRSLTACQDETWYIGTQSLMYDLFMICLITWHVRVCLGIVEHCIAVLRFRIWWQVAVNSSSTCPESSPGRWRMIFSFHILCCFSLWRIKGWLIKTVTVADAWSMIRYCLYH